MLMKKRVLIVITTAFVPAGGLTGVVMNYYRKIDKRDILIDIASTNKAPITLTEEIKLYGSHYYCLNRRSFILSYFFKLYKLCKNYDIIHVNGNSATTFIELLAAKLAGIKIRINHNHTSIPYHRKTSNMVYPFFKNLVTERIACSDLAGKWLYRDGDFFILKNAVDVDKYQYNKETRKIVRGALGIKDDCCILGHVGKIYKPKNHSYLVRIFAEFFKHAPNSKLLLVGDGVMRAEIEELVSKLRLREHVIFAGLRMDIPDMLQAMDFFVFPSIWEGMPLSVLEALSSGLTCVISDHITKDVMIGPHIHSLQIESDPVLWADFMLSYHLPLRQNACSESTNAITEAGFNIKTEARKLMELYMK